MKTQSGKTQALSGLLLYRTSSGHVDNEYFASILQQIYRDQMKNIHVDFNALKNSLAAVDLNKLVNKKRFQRKSDDFQRVLKQYAKQTNQSNEETTPTIGDILSWWVDLTHQNTEEFMSRVAPKINALVAESGDAVLNQNPQNELTEATFRFGQNLLRILLSETPPDKKAALVEHVKETILNMGNLSNIDLPDEILNISFRLIISDSITKMEDAFFVNPAAKISLQQPLLGAVIEIMAKKYDWQSGVPDDNNAKLKTELKEKGIFFNERTQSCALKTLARRNILHNIESAMNGTLMNDLAKIILDRRASQQNQTQSEYVYEPISADVDTETRKKILELIFKRRNEDGKPDRNY
jgi:hypothetical protein